MEPSTTSCSFQPSIMFLLLTLLVTSAATAMLCVAIMTENWEYITWDKEKLISIEKNVTNESSGTSTYKLEWLLDGQVARVVLKSPRERKSENSKDNNELPALFFTPIHSGIWTFCIALNGRDTCSTNFYWKVNKYMRLRFGGGGKVAEREKDYRETFLDGHWICHVNQQQLLINMGFPKILCTNYLKLGGTGEGNSKMDWQHRMQNLSISCALVCLIILSSSAVIGVFGVTKRQISAVLITGVMYLLAAVFATFSLTIIHFKRVRSKTGCLHASTTYGYTVEGVIVSSTALEKSYNLSKINKYFEARIFTTGWSLHLGWGGVAMCILVSILWILLSKIMRFNLINTSLAVL